MGIYTDKLKNKLKVKRTFRVEILAKLNNETFARVELFVKGFVKLDAISTAKKQFHQNFKVGVGEVKSVSTSDLKKIMNNPEIPKI